MTIEIRKPELEALIREWMQSGAFEDVEDVLMQALKSSPLAGKKDTVRGGRGASRYGSRTCGGYGGFALQGNKPRSQRRTRTCS